jgi:hypothetical protein
MLRAVRGHPPRLVERRDGAVRMTANRRQDACAPAEDYCGKGFASTPLMNSFSPASELLLRNL